MKTSLKSVLAGLVLVVAGTGFAQAAPVVPLDFTAGLNTGYFVNPSSIDENVDWFIFDSDGINATSFYFNRTVAAPDLIAGLYEGDTTGFDYVAAGAPSSFSFHAAANYNPALTLVGYWDDTHDDALGGPWGDPHFAMILGAGRYSLALSSLNASGSYEFTTNQTSAASAVPEPATTALLGLGLVGFAAARRKSAKSKNA